MKDYLSFFDLAVWLALIAGKVFLCLCIVKKHFFRRLPWFSFYVFVSTTENLVLLGITYWGSYLAYYNIFYLVGHIDAILIFVTLLECARQVLPGLDLPDRNKALAWLSLAVAAVVIFAGTWPLNFLENRLEVGAFLVVAVTFFFVTVYARFLGLYWSRLIGGIALTLGLLCLLEGGIRALTGHSPPFSTVAARLRDASQITSFLAVVAWNVVILAPWGEHDVTEEDLAVARRIIDVSVENLRHVAQGGGK